MHLVHEMPSSTAPHRGRDSNELQKWMRFPLMKQNVFQSKMLDTNDIWKQLSNCWIRGNVTDRDGGTFATDVVCSRFTSLCPNAKPVWFGTRTAGPEQQSHLVAFKLLFAKKEKGKSIPWHKSLALTAGEPRKAMNNSRSYDSSAQQAPSSVLGCHSLWGGFFLNMG